MLVICLSGSKPVRRWNSAIVCLSACDSAASAWTLAAAGLARSCAASTPATMRAEAGNSAMRPCTVSLGSAALSRRHPPRQEESATSAATTIVRRMTWVRMKFKGERVWIRADASGKPELDSAGRAEMKYRESDEKSYRPLAANLEPDGDGGETKTFASASMIPPVSARPKAAAPAVKRDGKALELWTDGACSGNPGPMGIGIVAVDGSKRKEHGEYLGVGTNNIAELTAIDRALDLIGGDAAKRRLRIYTDSAYSIGVL